MKRLQTLGLQSLYQWKYSPLLRTASQEIALKVIIIGHIVQNLDPPQHRKNG
jgi:Ni,Fe-hydrogenase maturation factor